MSRRTAAAASAEQFAVTCLFSVVNAGAGGCPGIKLENLLPQSLFFPANGLIPGKKTRCHYAVFPAPPVLLFHPKYEGLKNFHEGITPVHEVSTPFHEVVDQKVAGIVRFVSDSSLKHYSLQITRRGGK